MFVIGLIMSQSAKNLSEIPSSRDIMSKDHSVLNKIFVFILLISDFDIFLFFIYIYINSIYVYKVFLINIFIYL